MILYPDQSNENRFLPLPATTGWNALRAGEITPGSTVVLPGTGVTALQTLQLAKAAGARVIITSSSDEKLERAKVLGADEGINYRATPDWQDEVLRITDGLGADLVLETTGTETFSRSLKAVRHGGTVYAIGFVSGRDTPLDLLAVIGKAIRMRRLRPIDVPLAVAGSVGKGDWRLRIARTDMSSLGSPG